MAVVTRATQLARKSLVRFSMLTLLGCYFCRHRCIPLERLNAACRYQRGFRAQGSALGLNVYLEILGLASAGVIVELGLEKKPVSPK
jgi:hypothetical protein